MASDETIGLQAAADHLGVHYQTAYQWVRRGDLPAHQIGRQYVIEVADLDAFQQARQNPAPPVSRVPREGFATALPRFHGALVNGDEAAARRIFADYADTGTPVTDIVEGLLAPAMRQIGQEWADGITTVAVEHRASAIAERLLAAHLPRKRGRPRGRALVTTPTGDHHGLSAYMATVALKEAGWKVHHLGADMPTDELADFAHQHDIGVVVLSSATDEARAVARQMIIDLAAVGVVAVTNDHGMGLREVVAVVEAVR